MTITQPPAYRPDCAIRLQKILESMGDVTGKSMVDIGCANGYFLHGFLENGGKSAVGIDNNVDEYSIARAHGIDVFSEINNEVDSSHFNFGLYLDLHFHTTDFIPWLKEHCDVSFISPSGEGERNNMRLADELMKHYNKIGLVYKTDYANRMIFRCE